MSDASRNDDDISGLDTIDGFLVAMARVSDRPLPYVDAAPTPTPSVPPLPEVPREQYTIGAEVGRGGMGRVFVAEDQRLGRRVAIKELLGAGALDRARFWREALITARLQHPAIVPVHEAGRWPSGEPFYAMKLVSGRPLSRLIDEAATPQARLGLLPVMIAVADAVAYAHSQRVIHRDLKPNNVIVGEFGETMVIDWGLAKALTDPSVTQKDAPADPIERAETEAGALLGTPGFMAPEQARGQPADERSDVFSLGAMLYALLAGRAPYRARTISDVLAQTLAGRPAPLPRTVPVELAAIVDKALAPAPQDRYADAQALAADLRRFATGQLVGAHRYSRFARVLRWVRRRRALVLTVSVAGALLTAVGVVSVRAIVRERDVANEERRSALTRLDQLILSQGRVRVADDPTLALVWLSRLSPSSPQWRSARAVAGQAGERGVAFDGGSGRVVAFSPDGTHLASVDGDGRVRLYEWRPGMGAAQELPGRVGRGQEVAFSADGARVAASGDAGLRLYATGSRQPIALAHDVGEVHGLAFADGNVLVAAAEGGVHLWSADGKALPAPPESAGDTATRLAVAGRAIAWRDQRGVALWAGVGATPQRWPAQGDGPLALTDSHLVFTDGASVVIRERASGRTQRVALPGVVGLALTSSLAACVENGIVARVDLADGKMTPLAHAGDSCRALATTATSVAATRGEMVRVWRDHSHVLKLRTDGTNVVSVAFSPDGRWLASGSESGVVRLWSVDGDADVPPPEGWSVERSPTALSLDGWLRVRGGQLEFDDHRRIDAGVAAPLLDVAWQGRLVATAGENGVALVDTTNGAVRARLPDRVARLALSRDGSTLATVGDNGLVQTRAVDVDGRLSEPRTVVLEPGAQTVALSPDGRLTAVARRDTRVAQLYEGVAIARSFEVENPITALQFVDQDLIAVGAADGSVTLEQLSTGQTWSLVVVDKSAVVTMATGPNAVRFLLADGQIGARTHLPPGDPAALRRWISERTRARLDDHDEVRFDDAP